MSGYSGPRLRPSPDTSARALSDAWAAPGEDPGVGIDKALNAARAPYRLRSVNGLPRETDDGEVVERGPGRLVDGPPLTAPDERPHYSLTDEEMAALAADYREGERQRDAWNAAHPVGREVRVAMSDGRPMVRSATESPAYLLECGSPVVDVRGLAGTCPLRDVMPLTGSDQLPPAAVVALESERPGVTFGGPPGDAPDGPGDRPQPVEHARDLMGVLVEINMIAAHLPELAATVGRLVPGAPVPGGLTRKLGTLRARTATAAAGIGAVVRDLTGPKPDRPAVAGVGTGDALGDLIVSLMKELADLLADRRCEAPWDEAKRERLRATAAMIAIVAGAKA